MARVLVTHPYHLALDPREVALGRPYPPLSTLVVASSLRDAGHAVTFHDPMFLPDERGFAAVVARERPEAVLVLADDHSVQIKQCLGRVREAAMSMAGAARGVPVLVAGPDVREWGPAVPMPLPGRPALRSRLRRRSRLLGL